VGTLIDTSILIAIERGDLSLANISARADQTAAISVITASELMHGVERATSPLRRASRARFVEGVLTLFPPISIDLEIARVHARITAELALQGAPIGAHDAWIAATALTLDYSVSTHNVREFDRIPELEVRTVSAN
jgi:tRNA(fMet)-specific endonuclease VapC